MRRILYLWLPQWPIDRRRSAATQRARRNAAISADAAPFATVADDAGRRVVAAVNQAAAAAGIAAGMPLADALSFVPGLVTAAATPTEDALALRRLAEWCGRYSPWTAPDGADGIKIEITGCAALWGGEAALVADFGARLGRRGIDHRVAVADTLGAAWACARFAPEAKNAAILPPAGARAALAPLPVEALRLDPAIARGLRRVGLKRVGDLYPMPRSALARRFGEAVARRLDQAFGDLPEPLSPIGETPTRRVRLSFAEPIADPADLALAIERLCADLVTRLASEGTGARRLVLGFHRVDGRVERIALGTARPNRDPRHLAALFNERLDTVDPGLGVEDMILAAFAVEPMSPEQLGFAGASAATRPNPPSPSSCSSPSPHPAPSRSLPRKRGSERQGAEEGTAWGGVSALFDRLGNRFGLDAVFRFEARESHIPERASVSLPIASPSAPLATLAQKYPVVGLDPAIHAFKRSDRHLDARVKPAQVDIVRLAGPPRPIRLFDPPEPIEAAWLLPDDPPFRFTWRRRAYRVARADGPERVAEEWWRLESAGSVAAIRDYYRIEDQEGRRFWLFRAGLAANGPPPRWYVHGLFP
jgi:protein ImuB